MTSCECIFWAASSSACDIGTFFSPSRTDPARMYSSKPGAEKTVTTLTTSLPILETEIHVLAGMYTVAPACTSFTVSPKVTLAVPDCRKRISSALGCLCVTISPRGASSPVKKTRCEEPPFCGSTLMMKVSPGSGCPGQPLTTRRSPSAFSRTSGTVLGARVVCDGGPDGALLHPHERAAQTPTKT